MSPHASSQNNLIEDAPSDNELEIKESHLCHRRTPSRTTSHKFRANSFVTHNSASFFDYYEIIDILGEGGYGQAYICEHKESCEKRAVKVLDASDTEARKRVLNEFDMLKGLDHPNLIKTYQLYEDKENTRFFIVSDLYHGGELFDDIAQNGPRSEEDAAVIMNQLLSCVNYLHSQGIAHRDLKLENMLLGSEDLNADDMKVIDFGLSSKFNQDQYDQGIFEGVIGSTYYMAPEILAGRYGPKVDIWSCGVILFVLLSGDAPFHGETDKEIFDRIQEGDFTFDNNRAFKKVSHQAKDFIRWLLSYEEDDRPTAEKALKHPWMVRARRRSRVGLMKRDSKTIISSLANLERFSAESKLEQAVYAFISSQLISSQERDDINKLFRTIDCDCDGKISKDELRRGYRTLLNKTLGEDELDDIFRRVNFSCSDTIEYSEFVVAAMNAKLTLDEYRLRAVFREFDQDRKGYLTAADLNRALELDKLDPFVRDCTLSKMMTEIDTDRDGVIDFQEFQNALVPLPFASAAHTRSRRFAIFRPPVLQRSLSEDAESKKGSEKGMRKTRSGWFSALQSNKVKVPVHNPAA